MRLPGVEAGMSLEPADRFQVLVIFHLTRADLGRFEAYERAVLSLLERHTGHLERVVRAKGSEIEVHLLQFDTREDFERFRADPQRLALTQQFSQSGAEAEIYEVHDVDVYRV
jgi:antibiotic biosynthesis monooxygenase (ABM) superfamily enzyme